MEHTQTGSSRYSELAVGALLLFLVALSVRTMPVRETTPDVSGDWEWNEQVLIVGPGDFMMIAFGIPNPEGPLMHLTCDTSGTLSLVQNGASVHGSATQFASCMTGGGQSAAMTPFPPFYSITGSIRGLSLHFSGPEGCSYQGSLSLDNGVASALNATGKCDVPIPVQPLVVKNVSFNATRL